MEVAYNLRSHDMPAPLKTDDVYIADTMGELGLFYTLCPIAMIGRSFSHDGGGGHNPFEAAQLECVVITGPNNQYQRGLYDDMKQNDVVIETKTHDELYEALKTLLTRPNHLNAIKEKTKIYATQKSHIIDDVINKISPYLNDIGGNK
jgi:3-deoxy-D-manno-octulosonic-acid transferase